MSLWLDGQCWGLSPLVTRSPSGCRCSPSVQAEGVLLEHMPGDERPGPDGGRSGQRSGLGFDSERKEGFQGQVPCSSTSPWDGISEFRLSVLVPVLVWDTCHERARWPVSPVLT